MMSKHANFTIHFAAVPRILRDALHVTSQNIEAEMAKTLKLAFEYTGETVALWSRSLFL